MTALTCGSVTRWGVLPATKIAQKPAETAAAAVVTSRSRLAVMRHLFLLVHVVSHLSSLCEECSCADRGYCSGVATGELVSGDASDTACVRA